MQTFNDAAEAVAALLASRSAACPSSIGRPSRTSASSRPIRRFPYVPNRKTHLDQDCYEAFNIQVEGLRRRFEFTGGDPHGDRRLRRARFHARADRRRQGLRPARPAAQHHPRLHHAGLRHRRGDEGQRLGADARARRHRARRSTSARRRCRCCATWGIPSPRASRSTTSPSRTCRPGCRTDYLFRLANQRRGFVIGTGDLSELALGWCTYGVGDQMSHYAVNAGVPKTLIQYLIRWAERTDQFDRTTRRRCSRRSSPPRSRPELRAGRRAAGPSQSTEAKIGPYELHDFFLYHIMRYGQAPSKVAFLALHAWSDVEKGLWPIGFPPAARHAYDLATIRRWLEVFLGRFFALSQFKRSALPERPQGLRRRRALAPRRLASAVRRHRGAVAGRAAAERPGKLKGGGLTPPPFGRCPASYSAATACWLAAASARPVRASSVLASSCRVASRSLAASAIPSTSAQRLRVP